MRKSGRKLVSAALTAAMALSLAACGGQAADATTAAETTTEAASQEETTAQETTEEETQAEEPADNQQADIVVIGAGGAGMTAAIQAVQDGATDVVILENAGYRREYHPFHRWSERGRHFISGGRRGRGFRGTFCGRHHERRKGIK